MAEKGIIIDVGFRGEYKKFIDEIEKEFQSIDFSKSINLSKEFAEQEKEVRKKLENLKKLMDEVLGGKVGDTPKQLQSMQSAVLHLSKAVKDMMVNANPADVEKFGGAISDITGDIDKLTTSCTNAQNVISEMSKNKPVKFVDEDQKKELIDQYKALKKVSDVYKESFDLPKKKPNNTVFKDNIDDIGELQDLLKDNAKMYLTYEDMKKKAIKDTTISEEDRIKKIDEYNAKILKHMTLYHQYSRTAYDLLGNDSFSTFSFPVSGKAFNVENFNKKIEKNVGLIVKEIENSKIRLQEAADKIDFNIADYFTKSEAKNESIKIPISLGYKYDDLLKRTIKIIDDINHDIMDHPLKIEISPVSNYFNKENKKRLEDFRKRFESLGVSEEIENQFKDFINEWNNGIDNSLMFNVYVNTVNANKQIHDFVEKAKKDLKGIQTYISFTPEMIIKEGAKEQVEKQLNELFENINVVADVQKIASAINPKNKSSKKKKDDDIPSSLNMGEITKSATKNIEAERSVLDKIDKTLDSIIEKINQKTEAFINEDQFVQEVTGDEVACLSRLYDDLGLIQQQVLDIAESFQNLPSDLTLGLNISGISNETANALTSISTAKESILQATGEQFANTIQLSDEDKQALLNSLSDITTSMGEVFNTNQITAWQNKFKAALGIINESINENIFNPFQSGFEQIKSGIVEISEKFQNVLGTNPVSNQLINTLKGWTEADKIITKNYKSVKDEHLKERGAGINTKTGYVTNGYLYDEHESIGYGSFNKTDKNINAFIHSHPSLASYFSIQDLKVSLLDLQRGITEEYLKNIYNVIQFKSKEFLDNITDENGNKISLTPDFFDEFKKYREDNIHRIAYSYATFFSDLFDDIDFNSIFPSLNISKDSFLSEIKSALQSTTKLGVDFEKENVNKVRIFETIQKFLTDKNLLKYEDAQFFNNKDNIEKMVGQYTNATATKTLLPKYAKGKGINVPNIEDYYNVMSLEEFEKRFSTETKESLFSSLFDVSSLNEFKETLDDIIGDIQEIIHIIPENGIQLNIGSASPLSVETVDSYENELLAKMQQSKNRIKQLQDAMDSYSSKNQEEGEITTLKEFKKAQRELKKEQELLQNLQVQWDEYRKSKTIVQSTGINDESVENISIAIDSLGELNQKFIDICETIESITDAIRDNLSEISDFGKVYPLDDLTNTFNEYKKFYDAGDLNSESGAKAYLKYLNAYKNAIYSKVSKKDIKEYTLGSTDKYFTGNYKTYTGKNGSIKDLDLSGIESEISKYKDVLLNSTGIPALLDVFQNNLKEMFTLPETAGELQTFLESLRVSLTIPEGTNTVSDALNTLKKSIDSLTNSKADEKLNKLFESIETIIEKVQSINTGQGLPIIKDIDNILSKKDELKDLVKVLESSAKKISAAEEKIQSEENFYKASSLLSNHKLDIENAIKSSVSGNYLGAEMKALKNGLVEVTAFIEDSDNSFIKYTYLVDENLTLVNTKINNNIADLKKLADVMEEVHKEENKGKNNLGSDIETFTPKSKNWDVLIDKISEYGVELGKIDKIIRHVDEEGQESFQVFSGLTRVTVGMDSEDILYRKDTVLDAAGAIEEYQRRIKALQNTVKNAFKGDDIAVKNFVIEYNKVADVFEKIQLYASQGIIPSDDVENLQGMVTALKTSIENMLSSMTSENMFEDYEEKIKDFFSRLSEIFSGSLSNLSILTKDQGEEIQTFLRDVYKTVSTKNDKQNKVGNDVQITKLLTKITDDMSRNSNMTVELRRNYEQLAQSIESFNGSMTAEQVQKFNSEFMRLHYTLVQSKKTGLNFIDSIVHRLSDINVKWIAQLFSFHDWVRYIQQTANAVIQLDTALVDLKKTTAMTTSELDQFYFDANKIARQMGVTTEEIISQASAWSRFNIIDLLYGNV